MNRFAWGLFAAVTGGALVALPAAAETLRLEDVPPRVQLRVMLEAGLNEIDEIELEHVRGRPVYEVEWRQNGQEHEIQVDADGRVLGREVEPED